MKYLLALLFCTSAIAGTITVNTAGPCSAIQSGDNVSVSCGSGVTPTPTPAPVPPPTPVPNPPPVGPVSLPGSCNVGGATYYTVIGAVDWNTQNTVNVLSPDMGKSQVAIYQFTTGPIQTRLATLSVAEYGAAAPYRTVVISQTPCDFNFANAANPANIGKDPVLYFSIGVPNMYGYPMLLPNTTYFVNIRNAGYPDITVDTCNAGEHCPFVLVLSH